MSPSPKKRKKSLPSVLEFLKNYESITENGELEQQFCHVTSLQALDNALDEDANCLRHWKGTERLRLLIDLKQVLREQTPWDPRGELICLETPLGAEPNDVIQVKASQHDFNSGKNPPILIMGSSGSGKTLFSVKILPRLLLKNDGATFFVYMKAGKLLSDAKDATTAGSLMKECIERQLQRSRCVLDAVAKDLVMVVIIDEVGLASHRKCVGDGAMLETIRKELQSLAKAVRLVLAGTGLDQITTQVNSEQGSIKIRLQPWGQQEVNAYILSTNCICDNPEAMIELVSSTSLYRSLSTNPRALSHLVKTLQQQLHCHDKSTINQDFVIASVIDKYIQDNGLNSLDASEKRVVAMIVWKALADAKSQDASAPNLALPREIYTKVDRYKMEACCHSLLDVHLQSKDGKLVVVDEQDYSVSITSAIALVLLALVDNIAPLCRNWDSFETIVALNELQLAYVNAYPNPPPPLKVVSSRQQCPGKAKGKVRVPVANKSTIVVNGPKAQYCDVIAFDRLVQAKFTDSTANSSCQLDLKKELEKCGVLRECQDSHSAATTALLRLGWSNSTDNPTIAADPDPPKPTTSTDTPSLTTRHGFGVSKLFQSYQSPVTFSEQQFPTQLKVQTRPLSVVFVTNASEFNLPAGSTSLGVALDIQRQHVDQNGVLLGTVGEVVSNTISELQNFLDTSVVEGVSVKFLFLA